MYLLECIISFKERKRWWWGREGIQVYVWWGIVPVCPVQRYYYQKPLHINIKYMLMNISMKYVNVELYFWCVCGCVIIMYYVHVCIYVTMKAERCIDLICTRIQHFKSNTLRNH